MTANKDSERRKKLGEKLRARKKAPKGRGTGREEEEGQHLAQRLGAVAGRPRTPRAENSSLSLSWDLAWPQAREPLPDTGHGHRQSNASMM